MNLREKLEEVKRKEGAEVAILREVEKILKDHQDARENVLKRLKEEPPVTDNPFNIDKLESARIFHITHIQKLCYTYRLRFLSTKYYRQELPVEALGELREIEREHGIELQGFKIIAPASHFRLENADDPILFAPIGNNYFYLIHKWGKDLHPLRKLTMWPLKNLENFLVFSFITSFFLTFVIREMFFWRYQETSQFIMLYMFTFKSVAGLIIFYGIAMGKNFSEAIWDSKFYNS